MGNLFTVLYKNELGDVTRLKQRLLWVNQLAESSRHTRKSRVLADTIV